MYSFKPTQPRWKSCFKSTESEVHRQQSATWRRQPSQERPLTTKSKKITIPERSSSVKWDHNNVLPTTRTQTHQREETRGTRNTPPCSINKERRQQTLTRHPTQVICPGVHGKISLPVSSKTKGTCSCLSSSTLRNEVLRKSLLNYKASASSMSRSMFTSLPENLYKDSKLPIPNVRLGRKLLAAPERVKTTSTMTPWIIKSESEQRAKTRAESCDSKKSKIPLPLKERPSIPMKVSVGSNSPSLKPLLSEEVLYQYKEAPVPLGFEIPLPELALMNQKISQLRCVLATLQGTVNTMEKSIEELYRADKLNKDRMLARDGFKNNFESMGRVFKTVSNTLSQLKDLNMKALGFHSQETLLAKERTFFENEDSQEALVKRTLKATAEDSEIFEKGLDVIRTALEISLSNDEDITVEDLRNQIVDAQINLLDDAIMSPAMTITDQLLRSEELKNDAVRKAEEFIRSQQEFDPNQTIDEVIEEVHNNQLNIKARQLVMDVLSEILEEGSSQTISDISLAQIEETGSKMNQIISPIIEDIFTKEGNITIFELELSLQEAASILDAIDPCPSVTMASLLHDVLAPAPLKTTLINKFITEYPELTVGDVQNNLKAVQSVFHNAQQYSELTKIRQLMKTDYLSENPLVGKILRQEISSNPDRTILSLELNISDIINYLNEKAGPKTKLLQLPMLTDERKNSNSSQQGIKNISESLRASVEASENVTDVVMEAIVEASLKENPAISLAETKDNVIRAQIFLAVSSPSLTMKILDLDPPDLQGSLVIPRVINKAVAVRENMSVSELHQSFEEVKERLSKAAIVPHMIRLFHLLNEPNRLHLSPKCALLKDTILASSAPLALYWKNYYAEKSPQVGLGCSFPNLVKLKVKIIKNIIEQFKERKLFVNVLMKMIKQWQNVLQKLRQDQPATIILTRKGTSLNVFSRTIIEEIACRHPLRRISGLHSDVSKFIEQLNSIAQIGKTVDTFKLERFENDLDGLAFQKMAVEIVDVARSVDRGMPIKQLSIKMEVLKENLEEFMNNSTDATVTEVIEERRLQEEFRKSVIDVATRIHPGITTWQLQNCLSEIQNDLENVAIVPDQIAISSLCVEDPIFPEELILHTKNEIVNEAVKRDPDMSLRELKDAVSETHKCMLRSIAISLGPNKDLKTPNNFVMRAIRGCEVCAEESISDKIELLEKVGRNFSNTNYADSSRTVQEEQDKRLKEEGEIKEFNPFDLVFLANQYPPMRHAVVANILFKPLSPHMLRPFWPNLLKNSLIEQVPRETPVDFNGRDDVEFDFLGSVIQPYSSYKKQEYASRRSYEESTKLLFYEK